MGCGQSQIGIIYPRKSKHKDKDKDAAKRDADGSENEEEDKDGEGEAEDSEDARLRLQMPAGPLLSQIDISLSQNDFFTMLDEKIESGPDYDASCEYEIALEHARLCRLLHDWEMAKMRSRDRQAIASRAVRHVAGSNAQSAHRPRQSVVTYDPHGVGGYYTELA